MNTGVAARLRAALDAEAATGVRHHRHRIGVIMKNAFDHDYTDCGVMPPDDGCGDCDACTEHEVEGIEHEVETGAISETAVRARIAHLTAE